MSLAWRAPRTTAALTTTLAVTTALAATIALGGCAAAGNPTTAPVPPPATTSAAPAGPLEKPAPTRAPEPTIAPVDPGAPEPTGAPESTATGKPAPVPESKRVPESKPVPTTERGTVVPLAAGHADPSSTDVLVNKRHPLDPLDYAPVQLAVPRVQLATSADTAALRPETARAVEEMFRAAATEGIGLILVSGYRSHETQVATHDHWIDVYGSQQGADTVSARPGYSEHQTGLALDIGQADGTCTLTFCFRDTAAGAWAAQHAHEFGFVLRYPVGRQETTGYHAEPWHFRYVGRDISADMHTKADLHAKGALTLEEYFGFPPAPKYL